MPFDFAQAEQMYAEVTDVCLESQNKNLKTKNTSLVGLSGCRSPYMKVLNDHIYAYAI